MIERHCPICATPAIPAKRRAVYFVCNGCGVWYQDPPPPKRWHGEHETTLGKMGQVEKDANEGLAAFLFATVMNGKPGPVFDVGASYPWLAKCLHERGCRVTANDPSRELQAARAEFDKAIKFNFADFESVGGPQPASNRYALVTFVHSFEHLYDPLEAFRKLRRMVRHDGAAFIRCPDNTVPGYERDLTPGHYSIHPFYHALSSIAEVCAQTWGFVIESAHELRPGQRDIVLRPIT